MAFKPLVMKNVDLILGDEATGVNFKCQARSVVLTPEAATVRTKTLCPSGQFADVDDPEWTLEIGYLFGTDDEDPDEVLSEYLRANHADKVPFLFRPIAGGSGYKGTVSLIAGAIGGGQGEFSEQSVSLPVDGQPEVAAAPVGP